VVEVQPQHISMSNTVDLPPIRYEHASLGVSGAACSSLEVPDSLDRNHGLQLHLVCCGPVQPALPHLVQPTSTILLQC